MLSANSYLLLHDATRVSKGLPCWDVLLQCMKLWQELSPTWTCWKTLLRQKPKTSNVVSARVPSNATPKSMESKATKAPSSNLHTAFTKRLAYLYILD